jgi:hypothetical protein
VLSAYNAGANITSNSWGSNVAGLYDAEAQAYDALTRDASSTPPGNQEMLHVFSAGNAGLSGPQTVGSPAPKNVLTVGATEGVRDVGIPDGCGSTGSATADDIANFSSRGPTSDGRNKPDIVARHAYSGPASQDPAIMAWASATVSPAGQTLYMVQRHEPFRPGGSGRGLTRLQLLWTRH